MFIKYSDQTPTIDINETNCQCLECGCIIILANGRAVCGCNKKIDNGTRSAIKILTQKKEMTNIKK